MTNHDSAEKNDRLILKELNRSGGLTTQEIAQHTGLTKHQTRLSLARLKDSNKIFDEKQNYYPSASKLEAFVIHNIWNSQVFRGLAL